MKPYFFILILIILVILLSSCNYKVTLVDKEKPGVDSVLFYQQKDLADPFIDGIVTKPGNEANLKVTLYPPPPPPVTTRQIQGFRVQIFASSDTLTALTQKIQAADQAGDSIYLIHESGMFKVQIGDYAERATADQKKATLRDQGYPGCWVVTTMINIPLEAGATQETATTNQQTGDVSYRFKIQILATGDEAKALQTISELQRKFPSFPAYYEQAGNLYKVFLGKFTARPEAEQALQNARSKGYPDAWLVY